MTLRWPEYIAAGTVLVMLAVALLLWVGCVAATGIDGANHVCMAVGRSFFIGTALIGSTLWVSLRAAGWLVASCSARVLTYRQHRLPSVLLTAPPSKITL